MWRLIAIITRKELMDNLRDRRAIFNASVSVLLNPILFIALFGFMSRAFSEQAERQLQLPVIGAENAPNLIDFLEQRNVAILPAPADAATAILEGEHDVVLSIPDDYGERFEDGRPVPIEIIQDLSNQGSGISASRTERLLEQYSQQIGALRLLARGINPAVVSPLAVREVDVGVDEAGIEGAILSLLPVIMLTAAFLGGFYMVVDMTAGERERESLEPLLINPIPRWAVVIGKYLTGFGFTTFATMLAATVYLILLAIPAVQEFTNLRFELDGGSVVA
ncbi:MAG: ABC transporter permease, partial [Chloroflexota bacterium]